MSQQKNLSKADKEKLKRALKENNPQILDKPILRQEYNRRKALELAKKLDKEADKEEAVKASKEKTTFSNSTRGLTDKAKNVAKTEKDKKILLKAKTKPILSKANKNGIAVVEKSEPITLSNGTVVQVKQTVRQTKRTVNVLKKAKKGKK